VLRQFELRRDESEASGDEKRKSDHCSCSLCSQRERGELVPR
jgi:hypothetical protein